MPVFQGVCFGRTLHERLVETAMPAELATAKQIVEVLPRLNVRSSTSQTLNDLKLAGQGG